MSETTKSRKQRANGVESRRRILDATVEIAGERGYEGTSIAAVSGKWGYRPAPSVGTSGTRTTSSPPSSSGPSRPGWLPSNCRRRRRHSARTARNAMAAGVAKSLLDAPDFLRLGLMLALERRPAERRGRTVFLQVRGIAGARIAAMTADLVPGLTAAQTQLLTTYAVAASDGVLIAHEIDGDGINLVELFELHARTVYRVAVDLAAQNGDA